MNKKYFIVGFLAFVFVIASIYLYFGPSNSNTSSKYEYTSNWENSGIIENQNIGGFVLSEGYSENANVCVLEGYSFPLSAVTGAYYRENGENRWVGTEYDAYSGYDNEKYLTVHVPYISENKPIFVKVERYWENGKIATGSFEVLENKR